MEIRKETTSPIWQEIRTLLLIAPFRLLALGVRGAHFVWHVRRWWGTGVVVGLLLGLLYTLAEPRLYRATAILSLEPEIFNQNTISSLTQMTRGYALQIGSETNLTRVAEMAGWSEPVTRLRQRVRVEGIPEALLIRIHAEAESPERAIEIARTLVRTFVTEIEAENPRRNKPDRIRIRLIAPPLRAEMSSPHPTRNLTLGALGGLLVGFLLALLHTWHLRDRVQTPREVERLLETPTLGVIPR